MMNKPMKVSQNVHKNQGFTLVEMLVVAPILVLMIGAFIAMVITLTGEALRSRMTDSVTYSIQDALSQIQTDVELSTAFLAENDISVATSGQGYGDTATTNSTINFNNIDTDHNALILKLIATTENRNSSSGTAAPVYIANSPSSCSNPTLYASNTPMSINVVYFVANNTLWRRVIMPSDYATSSAYCGTAWQRPSCIPTYVAASRTFCKAADVALATSPEGVELTLGYYALPESTAPVTAATASANSASVRNTALQGTKTVQATIEITQNIGGETLQRNGDVRATRLE